MNRTPISESKHDARVRTEANSYQGNGYSVWADIHGWPQPEVINGYRPDVIAQNNGHTTVVEVETPDTVNSARDTAQQQAFREWASWSDSRHFRRVITN